MVFVGPLQTDQHIKAGLTKMNNVRFVGPKQLSDIPNYHQCFDCTILPFLKTKLTRNIYPMKINEYLAAGLPVIAIDFSSDIRSFGRVAYIVDTHEGFLHAIRSAIRENSPEKVRARISVASRNSWTARAERFWKIVFREMRARERLY